MNSIKFFRQKSKMTQRDLAKLLGVHVTSVTKWESGKSMPLSGKLQAIAKILGCSVDDLLNKQYKTDQEVKQ